jgi:hypothetical protein
MQMPMIPVMHTIVSIAFLVCRYNPTLMRFGCKIRVIANFKRFCGNAVDLAANDAAGGTLSLSVTASSPPGLESSRDHARPSDCL